MFDFLSLLPAFTPELLLALWSVILIDLVMGADNAIIIGSLASKLPPDIRTKAIMWGTAGAIVARIAATLAVVWLLKYPVVIAAGAIYLVYVAWGMVVGQHDTPSPTVADGAVKTSLWAAATSILVADIVMGVDNMLAVASVGHGDFFVVIVGLLLSIPIMVGGASIVSTAIARFPSLMVVGALLLVHAAASMLVTAATRMGFIPPAADPVVQSIVVWAFSAFITFLAWVWAHVSFSMCAHMRVKVE